MPPLNKPKEADPKDQETPTPSETPNDDRIASMTPEELELNRKRFMFAQGHGDDPDLETPPEDDGSGSEGKPEGGETPPEGDDPPEGEEAGKPAEGEEPPAEEEPAPDDDSDDDDRIGRVAAETAARTASEIINKAKGTRDEETPSSGQPLTRQEQRDVETLKWMQENNPDYKGKDLVSQAKEYWTFRNEYEAAWRKDNPGARFNPKDDEHLEVLAKRAPDYDDRDFYDARVELGSRPISEENKQLRLRVKRMEDEARKSQVMPKIQANSSKALADIAAGVADEIKAVVKEGDEFMSHDKAEKLKEVDPIAHRVLSQSAGHSFAVVSTIHQIYQLGDQIEWDSTNPVHAEIERVGKGLEDRLAKSKTVQDGKRFLRQSDYADELSKVDKLPTELKPDGYRRVKERFFTVDENLLVNEYVKEESKKVKKEIQAWRDATSPGKPAKTETPPKDDADPPAKPSLSKPKPPSSASPGSDRTNPSGSSGNSKADRDAAIDQAMGWA